MRDLHLHRLHLQVLGGDPAHFVRDLVALNRDVLPVDAETHSSQDKDEVFRFMSPCCVDTVTD